MLLSCSRPFRAHLVAVACLGLAKLLPFSAAQTPAENVRLASVRLAMSIFEEGQTLYIIGGYGGGTSFQDKVYAVDLSKSWPVDSPAYTSLPSLPLLLEYPMAVWIHQSSTGGNNKEILVFSDEAPVNRYNTASKTWQTEGPLYRE